MCKKITKIPYRKTKNCFIILRITQQQREFIDDNYRICGYTTRTQFILDAIMRRFESFGISFKDYINNNKFTKKQMRKIAESLTDSQKKKFIKILKHELTDLIEDFHITMKVKKVKKKDENEELSMLNFER